MPSRSAADDPRAEARNAAGSLRVGDEVTVDIGPVAHGGHFIAHAAGRTMLVRHALTGERVRVKVTSISAKVVRADAIEVLLPSPERVEPPCPSARPGGCGGCDFQHVRLAHQRELKGQVIADAFRRQAGMAGVQVPVQALGPVPGSPSDDGLGWRTRIRWHVDATGRPGLSAHRSREVVPVEACLLAAPAIAALDLPHRQFAGVQQLRSIASVDGQVSLVGDDVLLSGPRRSAQAVRHRHWRVDADSFWQVHPQAATALVDAVLESAEAQPGQLWWDLYAGVGLFSAFIGEAVGRQGRVDAVESSASAVRDARRALHDLPQVRLHQAEARAWVQAPADRPSGVVLDPPRAGAGRAVIDAIIAAGPAVIVYVACDPVSMARDVAWLAAAGYRVARMRAFDTFPMTHHVETVVALVPSGRHDEIS